MGLFQEIAGEKKMNCKEAKSISIFTFLANLGFHPQKRSGDILFYNSPLRVEKTPSFKVDIKRNLWIDFGLGEGGDIVALIKKIYKTDVQGALKILSDKGKTSFSFPQQNFILNSSQKKIEIRKIAEINNKELIKYLNSRKIPVELARQYCCEVYFNCGKAANLFSIGFKNDQGGFELRNSLAKQCVTPKAISTIDRETQKVNVFEGFFDFLSALVFFKQDKPKNTTIVLNSLSTLKSLRYPLKDYSSINIFFDNDLSGKAALERLESLGLAVVDRSNIYKEYKDFNDFICAL